MKKHLKTSGLALAVAIIVTAVLLLIVTAMANLALKQASISSSARDSQIAFYAADTGMECALYWDIHSPSGTSAFSTSTGSQINCNNQSMMVGGSSKSVFTFNFSPDPFCTIVTVTKNTDGSTLVESEGYNTCDPTSTRRVERAVRARY